MRSWNSIGLIAQLDARGAEAAHFGVQIVDREADVVEAGAGQVAGGRIGMHRGSAVGEQLDLEARVRTFEHQRAVLGLDAGHAHVGVEGAAGDDHRLLLAKAEQGEELQAGRGIADGDGDVIDIPDNDSSFIS